MATVIKGGVSTRGNVTGGISRAETVIIKEVEFHNRCEFPQRGYTGYLYVATDENKIYRWDNEEGYLPQGSEINDETTSLSSTWSSKKINTEINNVSEILDYATDEDIRNLF